MANASLAMIFLRLTVAVAVVVGLLLLTARLTRRVSSNGQGGSRSTLRVVARQPLSRYASVAIVAHGSRTFVLGVTDHSVSLIAEQTDLADQGDRGDRNSSDGGDRNSSDAARLSSPQTSGLSEPATPLANLVESIRERTIRRPR